MQWHRPFLSFKLAIQVTISHGQCYALSSIDFNSNSLCKNANSFNIQKCAQNTHKPSPLRSSLIIYHPCKICKFIDFTFFAPEHFYVFLYTECVTFEWERDKSKNNLAVDLIQNAMTLLP